jgi:propanol-preferring alcohol dehydrogenase
VRAIFEGGTAGLLLGMRVGVFWMGGVDDDCWCCHRGMQDLSDKPTLIRDMRWIEAMPSMSFVRTLLLPASGDDIPVAPLLCAGIIGFRTQKPRRACCSGSDKGNFARELGETPRDVYLTV